MKKFIISFLSIIATVLFSPISAFATSYNFVVSNIQYSGGVIQFDSDILLPDTGDVGTAVRSTPTIIGHDTHGVNGLHCVAYHCTSGAWTENAGWVYPFNGAYYFSVRDWKNTGGAVDTYTSQNPTLITDFYTAPTPTPTSAPTGAPIAGISLDPTQTDKINSALGSLPGLAGTSAMTSLVNAMPFILAMLAIGVAYFIVRKGVKMAMEQMDDAEGEEANNNQYLQYRIEKSSFNEDGSINDTTNGKTYKTQADFEDEKNGYDSHHDSLDGGVVHSPIDSYSNKG